MGNRRSGCIGIGILLIVAAVVVVATVIMVGPRFSDTLRRLADRIATPTGALALADAPTAASAPAPTGVPAEAMVPEEAAPTLEVTPAAAATRAQSQPSPTKALARAAATPSPRPTSTPPPDAVVTVEALNLRSGPGTNYPRVGSLRKGDALDVIARTNAGDWLQVIAPGGAQGWVAANLVDLAIALDDIPVAKAIPTPPFSPTPKAPPTPVPTLSVDDQIARIAKGQHGVLPQPGAVGGISAGGEVELTVLNDTPYQLTVLVGAPNGTTIVVEPCPSCKVYSGIGPLSCQEEGRPRQVVRIKPGSMQVAARVSNPSVVPFLGTWNLNGDTKYFNCFFIVTRLR